MNGNAQWFYEKAIERYDKRREIEWKVTAGLWTAIVAITGLAAGKVQISFCEVLPVYSLIWLAYCLVWTPGCWRANWNDMQKAIFWKKQVAGLAQGSNEPSPIGVWHWLANHTERRWLGSIFDWSRLAQVLGTTGLMCLSAYILGRPADS